MASLPWFKLWPGEMMDRPEWRRLSPEIRGLVSIAFSVIGRARSLGREATIDDLVDYTGYQRRRVIKMLEELGSNPFITATEQVANGSKTASKQVFTSGLFDVWQKSKDVSAAERMRKYRESTRNVTGNVTRMLRVEEELELDTELESELDKPRVVDAEPKKKPKPVKIVEAIAEVAFEPEDEVRVTALVLQHTPSGRVAPSTLSRLRSQFRAKLDSVGVGCWRYGVDTALAKPAGWPYALTVMSSNPTGAPPRSPSQKRPERPERFIPESLRITPEKLAIYERIEQRAIR